MFERIREMLIKEFIQVFRDPRLRIIIFAPPIIQLIVFGYAATTDVKHIATAVLDFDNTVQSRELVSKLQASGYFDIVYRVTNQTRIIDLMNHSDINAAFQIDKGFADDLLSGRTAHLQILVDGTDSNTASIILNYGSKIVRQFSENVFLDRIMRLRGTAENINPVSLETRTWFNENLESRNFYVPGLIATIIMLITLMLTCMAVVREKEIGTMEQIMVTPITPVEFILGKTVPFVLIGFFDLITITSVAALWFQVPIRGSFLLLFAATGFYILSALGAGLLISTISQTQQQAMMTTFFFFFPAVLLSGFMFPIANMPTIVQWLTYLNPMRYFLVVIRGIFLKGIGLDILWPQLLALATIGVITLFLAAKRLHKTLA